MTEPSSSVVRFQDEKRSRNSSLERSPSKSRERRHSRESRRRSLSYSERDSADAYYDSRASTQEEYRRRAVTLREYYDDHPELLPQLPFTLRHGTRRWKIVIMALSMVFDTCLIPIILYYAMTVGSNVQGWITFAVMSTVWGGLTYYEYALRSLRLIKKERFYRPLGTDSRWTFDSSHYIFTLLIVVVTALLIVGSAPHEPWVRVLAMPGPAILFSFTACIFLETIWCAMGWKAPFRISSTPKGGKVRPGVYYFIEDIVAVDGNAGRPYREALEARYEASRKFQMLMRDVSLFWSIGSVLIAGATTVVVVAHSVPREVAYGVGWAVPFIFAGVWTVITVPWVQRALEKEEIEWDTDNSKRAAVT